MIKFKLKLLHVVILCFIILSFSVQSEAEKPGGLISDPANDVAISHIDVLNVTTALNGETLTATFSLRDVPSQLTFDRTGVPANVLEYSWEIYIDVDNDKQTGYEYNSFKGIDYTLSAMHFVSSNSVGLNQVKPIVIAVQADVWISIENGGASYLEEAIIVVNDQLNTIELSGSIPGISISSNLYFATYDYNPGNLMEKDSGGTKLYNEDELNQAILQERRRWDVHDDNKKGLPEAIHALQVVAGIREVSETYNPIGIWNGTIHDTTIGGSGIIVDWELKDDNTMLGNWTFYPGSGGAISLNIDGNYFIDTNQMNFNTTGSATYTVPDVGDLVSDYTVTANGSMTSDTEAEGTYSIDFSDPLWPDNSGSWSVTKETP